MDKGVHVNGIEYPVLKIGQARLRVCLLPQHTKAHMDTFVRVFEERRKKHMPQIIREPSKGQLDLHHD